jgi:hypothetical protein
MKLQVICENCGKLVELLPEDDGNHAYVKRNLIDKDFYISDTVIECSSSDNIENLTDFDDIDIDTELKEIRIDCRDCGNYIVLT